MATTPEGKIQTAVCEYLTKKGYFFMRLNNAPIFDAKLNSGYGAYRSQGKYAMPGLADILLIDKEKYGMAIFMEIKAPKGKQSPDQKLFAKRCHTNNCEYYVIKSLDDVKKLGY